MNISIPIFETKVSGQLIWTTLGLGPEGRTQSGRSIPKLQQRLIDDLRRLVEKSRAGEIERFQLVRGLRIERTRLELTLEGAGQRRKVTGVCPLIVEPRWASKDERLIVVYHPRRQLESFWLRPDDIVADHARLFFQRMWADLDDDTIESLWCKGKERLTVVSFSAEPRSVNEDLPERSASLWEGLEKDPAKERKRKKRGGLRVLSDLGVNLTQRAAQGALAGGVPRSPMREQVALLLCGRKKQPALLVGAPGSGKTTILHRAVLDLLEADGYPVHKNLDRVHQVWEISGKRIIAGMSRMGEWEKRAVELLDDARRERVILFIPDLHQFGQIGRSRDSDRTLADLFRGPLARGEIIACGECTPEELAQLEQDAPWLAALFTHVPVLVATPAETFRLMVGEVRRLEREPNVIVSPLALRTLLEIGGSLLPGRALPGKAIEMLRELARGASASAPHVGPAQVIALLSRKTGLPALLLQSDERLDPAAVEEDLGRQVIGQREAVRVAADLILRIKSGLLDPRRPYGVYLFTGPTGTSKTELAKSIAEYLYGDASRLLRFDMSELSGPDAPARLIGDRFRWDGLLTRQIQEQPFSVVLFDEIEKAHPSVLNLLLQLFDEGRLTDARGVTADFTHAAVIMTSNLGARSRSTVGFGEADSVLYDIARAVRDFFPPELFNRIDRVVPFSPLTLAVASEVAKKELAKLLSRRGLADRNIFVYPSANVTERIAREAFEARDGARSVKRYLEDRIGSLLTDAIAGGAPGAMHVLRLHDRGEGSPDGGFVLHRETLTEADPAPGTWAIEPLLGLSLRTLQGHLPDVLRFLQELEESDELTRLSERIRYHLAEHRLGRGEHADPLYNLEAMRLALGAFKERIEALTTADDHYEALEVERFGTAEKIARHGTGSYRLFTTLLMSRPTFVAKQGVLECIAEAHFLRRALRRVDDPARHAVFIEVLRGAQAARVGRFDRPPRGLLEALCSAYADARGELESFAARLPSGAIHAGEDAAQLEPLLDAGPSQVVLKMVGLCVLDFFELETGTHVWQSLAEGPEIVRVRVWPAPPQVPPAQVVSELAERLKAYEGRAASQSPEALALESPAKLYPVVRKIRFDPPRRPGALAPLELEDYALGYATTIHGRALADALPLLWLLKMSRTLPSEGEPTAGEASS